MTEFRTLAWQPWLAAVLILVLCLTGAGRGWVATPDGQDTVDIIAGIAAPICHTGHHGDSVPDAPGHHDCCDSCALCAALTLARTPDLTAPTRVIHYVTHVAALGWAPSLARPRTPRLAQGPPAA